MIHHSPTAGKALDWYRWKPVLKNVCFHCFCISLLHTQIHTCILIKLTVIGYMAIFIALPRFNDLGGSVTPIFLLMDQFLYQFSTFSEKRKKIYQLKVWSFCLHWLSILIKLLTFEDHAELQCMWQFFKIRVVFHTLKYSQWPPISADTKTKKSINWKNCVNTLKHSNLLIMKNF